MSDVHADEQIKAAPGCPVAHGKAEVAPRGRTTACGYAGGGKRGYFVPGIIALIVLLAAGGIINAAAISHSPPKRLDGPYVATQIADAYQTTHHLESPPPVTCPDNQPVAAGYRFTCELQRTTGAPLPIGVTETGGGQIRIDGAPF